MASSTHLRHNHAYNIIKPDFAAGITKIVFSRYGMYFVMKSSINRLVNLKFFYKPLQQSQNAIFVISIK